MQRRSRLECRCYYGVKETKRCWILCDKNAESMTVVAGIVALSVNERDSAGTQYSSSATCLPVPPCACVANWESRRCRDRKEINTHRRRPWWRLVKCCDLLRSDTRSGGIYFN
ncbi:unnamed protein product [Macrosiphum euphorbiae]|uniref:Uncharacterized protein n=1 Tax=Macrosiphum euphorbiae TaxID=13131 RepID=A0AAV0WPG3_9HEMI|nr:unnamed protein product [Macrosiphum euphorbiae]